MKKFKTRNKYNYLKIIAFILLLITFTFLSFIKLNKPYSKLINIITKKFKDENVSLISLTNNLDYLINTYSFIENNEIYNNSTEK